MAKHRKKQHYRRMVIAAVVLSAVGVPSVAMACAEWPDNGENQADRAGNYQAQKNHAAQNRQHQAGRHHHWDHHWDHHWKGDKSGKPTAVASQTPTASPSAHRTVKPKPKPKPTATHSTPKAPPSASAAPASPSTPKPTATASGVVARIVALVNAERSKVGCSALTLNATLTKAAQAHSQDMAAHQNMSHTGSDGSSPGDRITRAGYSWSAYGENVAYGYTTPEQVMAGWMSSPGHRANILNCSFKEIGVGLAQPNSYWTQDFGTAR
ncbi:CAP domain-containing protein [Streptomyces sp. NPDC005728]|uniref:CAP domain-containing protein n=1 Tax=Streptomyces sp. NPDC005728 TaxID=3157054 RepID=UPI0033E0D7A8